MACRPEKTETGGERQAHQQGAEHRRTGQPEEAFKGRPFQHSRPPRVEIAVGQDVAGEDKKEGNGRRAVDQGEGQRARQGSRADPFIEPPVKTRREAQQKVVEEHDAGRQAAARLQRHQAGMALRGSQGILRRHPALVTRRTP